MRPRPLTVGAALLAALVAAAPLAAQWESLRTDAFVLFYPAGREALAREILARLEAERPRVEELTGASFRRLSVVIEDLGTYANGLADPVFRAIHLYPYEPDAASESGLSQDWLRSIVVHELTHIGQLSAARGLPLVARTILGPAFATSLLSTRWMAEGLAVYTESWSGPYEGRLNEGLFDAVVAAQARAGMLPSIARATFSEEAYPFGNASYLYGSVFLRYLAGLAGEHEIVDFLAAQARSPLGYLSPALPLVGLDRMAVRSWGKSMRGLWQDWRTWERDRAADVLPERTVGSEGASELGGLTLRDGFLYYARLDETKTGRQPSQAVWRIVRLPPDGGGEESLVASPSGFSAPFVVRDRVLYYAVREIEPAHANVSVEGWGLTSVLRVRDLAGGRDRRLLRAPLRCFTVLDDGRVLYAVDATEGYGSEVWELPPGGGPPRLVRRLDLKVLEMASSGSAIVLCARTATSNTDLFLTRVDAIDGAEPQALVVSPWSERAISLDGARLLYAADPDGRCGAYALDLTSGEGWRYATGSYASWPCLEEGSETLYYAGIGAVGPRVMAVPAVRAEDAPAVSVAGSTPGAAEGVPARKSGYAPNLLTLFPRVRAPLVTADLRRVSAGVWLWGESAIGDISYDVRALYDFMTRTPSVLASLDLRFAAPFGLTLEYRPLLGHALTGTLSLTPWRGLESGLSSVRLELKADAYNTFGSLFLRPGALVGFRSPWCSGAVGAWVPIGRVELGVAANRVGVHAATWGGGVIAGGELDWSVHGAWDTSEVAAELPALRGHLQPPVGTLGATVGVAYERVLFRVRNGLWNPAVYLGDILGGAFVQGGIGSGGLELAAGVELAVEIRAFAVSSGLPIVLEGWVGVDEKPGFIYGVGVTADLPAGVRGAPPAWHLAALPRDVLHWQP